RTLCSHDTRVPATGRAHTNNAVPCDDGNPCTTGDACGGGTCNGGPATNCDDGNPCTDDSCKPATGCLHTNNTGPCEDRNPPTTRGTSRGANCPPPTTHTAPSHHRAP